MNAGKHNFTTLLDLVKCQEDKPIVKVESKDLEDKDYEVTKLKKKDLIKIAFKKDERDLLIELFTAPYVLSRIEDEAFFFLES